LSEKLLYSFDFFALLPALSDRFTDTYRAHSATLMTANLFVSYQTDKRKEYYRAVCRQLVELPPRRRENRRLKLDRRGRMLDRYSSGEP